MTRTTMIAFLAFAIAGTVAVTAFAVIDGTIYEIVFAVVLIVFTAYMITRVARSRDDNK
jgi:uncharacterized membrane protein YfcA